jgi:hypothetical protein
MLEGTTDNVAGSTTGNVTSGTASEAMIKAATAASSADSPAPGASGTGETTKPAEGGTPASTAGATSQPGTVVEKPGATGERGPIPFDRHEAALRNAREETTQAFAWAKELTANGLKPDEVKAGVNLLMRLRNDPKAFFSQLGEELGAGGGKAEEELTYPDADLSTQDGKVKAYSSDAMQKVLAVQEKKLLREFQKTMAPLMEHHERELTTRQQAEMDARIAKASSTALKQAETFPHFTEHKALIGEKLKSFSPEEVEEMGGPIAAMLVAYNRVLQEKVFPKSETDAEKRVREEFQRKANAASGSVHPGATAGNATAPKLENVNDLSKHLERLAAAAS